ncbi:MAG: hypothetical protein QOE13_127 [Gaiellaceae bacterium]|jgi:hypothetical protein|nr:hypothetical protein [Gaiellaceae bacterium]
MKALRLLLLAVAAFGISAGVPARVESTHLKLIVGVTDDTAKWMTRQDGIVGVHRDLRLMAVRVTVPWKPGQVQPTKLQQVYLHRIARMIQLNDRIVLSVYNVARYAPTAQPARNQYCAFLGGIVRRIPLIHDVEIWNEANSPTYWPQDDGATAYGSLLGRCYDVLHSRQASINVISSTASRHDPAGFVLDLGAAYRSSPRLRPLFDTFGHNPYPEHSAEPPWITHEGSDLIAQGDYETLMNVLRTSFEGTLQPLPGVRGVSIWYVEDGFQTVPPREKRRYYRGRENDPHALPAVAGDAQPGAVDQATQLRDAILLAYCQPAVTGFFNFGLLDEDRLGRWQAGLLWRDGSRKPSYDAFKSAIAEVRRRDTDCSKVRGAPAG